MRKGNKILQKKRFKKLIKHVNDEAEFFSRYKKAKPSNLGYVEIEQPQAHASFWKNIWEVPQNVDACQLEEAISRCRFSKHSTRLTHSPIKVEEVERALTFTAPWKACGPDGVYPHLYKMFKKKICIILARLFNKLWLGEENPEKWFTTGRTILFFKNAGDKASPKNYRPITMLNTCYKVFTSVIEGRVIKTLLETGNWDPEQRALISKRRGCLDAHLISEMVISTCQKITKAPHKLCLH